MIFEQFDAVTDTTPYRFLKPDVYKVQEKPVYLALSPFSIETFDIDLFIQTNILLPDVIERSVHKRQSEYFAGRYLSKILMSLVISQPSKNILSGEDRAPIWPSGISGSISHSNNTVGAIVGLEQNISIVGLDIENILTPTNAKDIKQQIAIDSEYDVMSRANHPENIAITLLFSAKESLYKALFPQVKSFFGFDAAQAIRCCPQQKTLSLRLVPDFCQKYGLNQVYEVYYHQRSTDVITMLLTVK